MPNPFSAIANLVRKPGFRRATGIGAVATGGAVAADEVEDRVEGMQDRLKAEGAMNAMMAMQQAEQEQMALEGLAQNAYSAGMSDAQVMGGMGGMESLAAARKIQPAVGNYEKTPVKPSKTGPGIHGVKTAAVLSSLPEAFMDHADLWKFADANWHCPPERHVKLASTQKRRLAELLKRIDS